MAFIPVDGQGRQAYVYDDRPLKVKISMWFWERIGIPLMGRTYRGKVLRYEHITGDKMKYVNCTFIRCKFSELRLFYLLNSYVEYETERPEFSNIKMSSIRNIHFRKVSKTLHDREIT